MSNIQQIQTDHVYEKESARFRKAWTTGYEAAKVAKEALNKMVACLHKDNPDWSVEQICNKIAGDLSDLPGFSKRNIQRLLSSENRALIQKRTPTVVRAVLQNKDTEPEAEYTPEQKKAIDPEDQLVKEVTPAAVVNEDIQSLPVNASVEDQPSDHDIDNAETYETIEPKLVQKNVKIQEAINQLLDMKKTGCTLLHEFYFTIVRQNKEDQ